MIRRKTTLRSKSGGFGAQNGNGNGNPRALVDDIVYREYAQFEHGRRDLWERSKMRSKLTTLKAKSGGVQNGNGNGNVRQLIDESIYREKQNNKYTFDHNGTSPHWDPMYSGWSNASRPQDYPIFLRPFREIDD